MLKLVKVLAIVAALGGAVAVAPTEALAQRWHGAGWHGGGWRGGGWGWGGGFGLGLGLGLAAPYYGGYYGPRPYYYYDDYASSCGWMRVRWRDGSRHRVWRCW